GRDGVRARAADGARPRRREPAAPRHRRDPQHVARGLGRPARRLLELQRVVARARPGSHAVAASARRARARHVPADVALRGRGPPRARLRTGLRTAPPRAAPPRPRHPRPSRGTRPTRRRRGRAGCRGRRPPQVVVGRCRAHPPDAPPARRRGCQTGAMATVHPAIPGRLARFVLAQPVFFVGTAPLAADGHVNVSPKGMAGTFAVLDPRTVAYLDYTGSGAETAAHLRE